MNTIQKLLSELDIIDNNSVELFYPKVRDNENLQVMRCNKSGVIFLSRNDHIDYAHYENWQAPPDRELALKATYEDDYRRFKMFSEIISGKAYLDVGTELGGILELTKGIARVAHGVELQNEIREILVRNGFKVFPNIGAVPDDHYDVVSLFHVFEHLLEPVETLADINRVMKSDATLIIEVPHAKDFLFNQLDCSSFKEFTFWSEHLILHTVESLNKLLLHTGFSEIKIEGFQRYPLANHLYWLRHQKPGGQKEWSHLTNRDIDHEYSNLLKGIGQTDTLIAVAKKK